MDGKSKTGYQEQISPTTAVEAYLRFVLNDLSQATNQMMSAAAELRLAASALEQKEMELAVKMDEVGSRLLVDIKRRAAVITEEELRKYRAAIGVQGVDSPTQTHSATPAGTVTSPGTSPGAARPQSKISQSAKKPNLGDRIMAPFNDLWERFCTAFK